MLDAFEHAWLTPNWQLTFVDEVMRSVTVLLAIAGVVLSVFLCAAGEELFYRLRKCPRTYRLRSLTRKEEEQEK